MVSVRLTPEDKAALARKYFADGVPLRGRFGAGRHAGALSREPLDGRTDGRPASRLRSSCCS